MRKKWFSTRSSLNLNVGSINNTGGTLYSVGNASVSASSLTNSSGSVQSQKALTLNVNTLDLSSGTINAANSVTLNTQGNITNAAGSTISSNGSLAINTNGSLTNQGTVSTGQDFAFSGTTLTNAANAVLKAGRDLVLTLTGGVTVEADSRLTAHQAWFNWVWIYKRCC